MDQILTANHFKIIRTASFQEVSKRTKRSQLLTMLSRTIHCTVFRTGEHESQQCRRLKCMRKTRLVGNYLLGLEHCCREMLQKCYFVAKRWHKKVFVEFSSENCRLLENLIKQTFKYFEINFNEIIPMAFIISCYQTFRELTGNGRTHAFLTAMVYNIVF